MLSFRWPALLRRTLLLACLWLLAVVSQAAKAAESCAIASAHPLATRAGCEVLDRGGTAFDAAIALTAALAVVEPFASGLGGGGFYLLHRADDGFETFIDARETAPARATREFYVNEDGSARQRRSLDGATAAAIPGIPAAIDWLAGRYASLPLQATLAAAVRLAREGFAVDARYAWAAGYREALLKGRPDAAHFLDGGKAPTVGFVLKQPQLAATLERLAREGRDGFYKGEVAERMVAAVRSAGGLWTLQDLAGYRVVEREPLRLSFRGMRVITAPLPSSGGLVLAQTLQILESLPLETLSEVQRAHFVVEAWRRGYNDRARFMGDPDFVRVPVARLASRDYARQRGASIDPERATPSSALPPIVEPAEEGNHTTHFSIMDRHGNRVAATLSINAPFGSGFVAGDTGVLLNNHMDDFTLSPVAPNLYKLVGNEANAIAPGKRPLSSMSPTFVEDARGVLVFGTPGGSRIISMVTLGILDYALNPAFDLARMLALPRYHHQYLPDRVEFEPGGFPAEWVAALRAKGHAVEAGRRKWGNMQAVYFDKRSGEALAEGDPRGKAGVLF
ncbi:MAG TPA: gamma-glutamyltransferase [Burkholderiales bacterium]|jgi:gamma-glutamyltranspeptidase/glutathione hydrolase|nr:gamma-glutamyltransferase [Burkholderiales bacterium]